VSGLLRANVSFITMDATPHYLLVNPHFILCACPWVKLVVILRNPAHRVHASYLTAVSKMGWTGTFDDYISLDVNNMKRAGLFSGGNNDTTIHEAWKTYLSMTADGPVGRSLYVIQLRRWFQALQEMGRDPSEAMIILRYEEYNENADREYQRVLKFLDLPSEQEIVSPIATSNNSMVVEKRDEKTMELLSKFFQPYNEQLYKLLGDGWKDCWND
jgi:hypothetical protein